MKDDDLETIKRQVSIFIERGLPIHIDLENGKFYNGNIVEDSSDFFMIDDIKIGPTPIFYLQIKNVEAYKKKGVENG